MLRDVLAITATIVILAVGTAFAFWNGVLFGQTITAPKSVAPKPAAKRTVTLVDRLRGKLTLPVQYPQKPADVKNGYPVVAALEPEDTAARPVDSPANLAVAILAL